MNNSITLTKQSAGPVEFARGGVTLTEVLMSLMIMSIGISSVMVLFPISVLRSVQSTQLTNAAILKYNTEALIRQKPALVFDPDGDYAFATTEAARYSRLSEHFGRGSRNYVVDPVGFHARLETDFAGAQTLGGILPRFDGGLLCETLRKDYGTITPSDLNPVTLAALNVLASKLGRMRDGRTNQIDTFAADDPNAVIKNNGIAVGVRLAPTTSAEDLIAIPTSDSLYVPLPDRRDIPEFPDPENTEITLYSVDGKFSQTYPLTCVDPANGAVYWQEFSVPNSQRRDYNRNGVFETRGLPPEFGDQIGRVVIRSVRQADFSWLLTVRRASDGQARGIDVVVRYHTDVKSTDELVYEATFQAGSGIVGVRASGDPGPVIKRGGFVFDAKNARWYRITNHEEMPASVPPGDQLFWKFYTHRLTIESPVISEVGKLPYYDAKNNIVPAIFEPSAMFLPGIVDVYPIGSLSLPDSL